MTAKIHHSLLLLGLGAAVTLSAQAQKLYRWVDDEGVVHYGEQIPPEYANRDRDVLNDQGVAVETEQGTITDEERAAMKREQEREAERAREQAERSRRDRMLLQMYLSVEDIENLRDRRLELLDSQIQVTRNYLTNLNKRLAELEKRAARYKPHNEAEDAQPMPEQLEADMARTKETIELYEQRLAKTQREKEELRESFAADIERFRELKGDGG